MGLEISYCFHLMKPSVACLMTFVEHYQNILLDKKSSVFTLRDGVDNLGDFFPP